MVIFIGALIVVAFWILVIGGFIGFLWELIENDVPLYQDIDEM